MDKLKFDPKKDITYFAKTNHRGSNTVFGIKRKDRRQHMYVLGKSGTGKSVLLSNMIIQNITNGEGVCVVDPHGELVEFILESIPDHRVNDVIYFNPADTDFHVGFNVLELVDPKYKHLVASGLMGIFTKIWANAWSARMEYILNNSILALLDTPGSTLLGIPRLLVDKEYRQKIIANVTDPVIKSFWVHEYEAWQERFRNEAIAPIQNKVGQFLSSAMIRNVVGQAKSTIDIFKIMNEGKIFLVNVSKGRIGEDNSALLGGMLITKVQLAAMERVRIPEEDRKDFYLYVDEFQNFATESFASILSEARKYRLNLVLAHQYIAQLITPQSTSVRDAVFGNVGTMIVFRVGAADAEFLEKEFEPELIPQDLVNLPNYHIYLKLMVDGVTSRPFSATTLPPVEVMASENTKEKIIETSRRLYTRPRGVIEEEINKWSGMTIGEGGELNGPVPEGKFKADCASCKSVAMVPFEPQPGRPVYCKDCITKIKKGELEPIRGYEPRRNMDYSDLSSLGIEFSQNDGNRKSGGNGANERRGGGNGPRGDRNNLKRNAPTLKPKRPADTDALQKILKKALGSPAGEAKVKELLVDESKKEIPASISLDNLKKKSDIKKVPPQKEIVAEKDVKIEKEVAIADEKTIPGFAKKDASDEHKNELKNALASAMNNLKEKSRDVEQPEKKPTAEAPQKKQPKEVPEEILRKILE